MRYCFFWKMWLTVFILFGLISLVRAEDEEAEGAQEVPLYEFPPVTITATRSPRSVKDVSATVSIITREDIEASNATSCTDILNTLPGLFVHKTGPFGRADVEIRGIGERGRKVMVLIDGRPVKMGLFGCTVTHSLPLDNVERIEVVRGPASVLYGSDALSGVINIITRRAKEGFLTDLTTSYGTYKTQQYRLRHGGNLAKFNYYFTGDLRLSDGHLDNSAYDGKDFTARLGYEIADNLGITLTSKYFDGFKEEPLRATDPDTMISDTWNDYKRGAVDISITAKWKNWNSLLKVYRNFGEHELSDGWHSKDFTNGAVLHGSGKLFASNELTVGTEFRQQGGERLHKPFPWEKEERKHDKYEYAVFFHDEQILLRKLILTFGGRYNQDEIAGGEFCPQAGLVFHPREGTIIRGAVNKGFRSPQLNELYMFKKYNEDLKPEIVWDYEIGLNQRIVEGVNLDLVGYIMKGEHLIQDVENLNPPPQSQFQNTGEFEFKGIEIGFRAQIMEGLLARFSYTYLDPGDKTTGRPGDKTDFALMYAWRKLAFSLTAQYVADYFAADNRGEPVPDYLVANAKLNYKIVPGLRAFLAVDNIFDTEYEIFVDLTGGAAGLYSMPERNITTGLSYEF